jgi:hypothetical protein
MLEEEPLTLKDKVYKFVFGLILFLLVVMLAITFLPGDAEKGLFEMLSGGASTTVGKVGNVEIPFSYYQRARKECYYRYKDYLAAIKGDESILDNCAFSNTKNLKIAVAIANSVGFDVSEQLIKKEISEEAWRIHNESRGSAGYSQEDQRTPDEIYQAILKEEDLHYRKDVNIARGLFSGFLLSTAKYPTSVETLEKESQNLKLSLNYVSFSDEELLKSVEKNIVIPEEEVKKEYDSEVASGKLPKDSKGMAETFEVRKSFLENKMRSERKQKKLEEIKASIESLKSGEKPALQEIAKIVGKKIESSKNLALTELGSTEGKPSLPSFLGHSKFLQDLSEKGFGKSFIGGPYKDSVNTTYVEFTDVMLDTKNVVSKQDAVAGDMRMLLFTFLGEINQSIGGLYPVSKYTQKQAN